MAEPLRVLLVEQNPENLATLKRLLLADEIEIVGDVAYGPAALTRAHAIHPDVIVVATEEPLARPLATLQSLTQGRPSWTVVSLVGQFERELFRKAVLAGARDVLTRTMPGPELREALATARRADLAGRAAGGPDGAQSPGTVVSIFGVKGGIGKTTLAVNLALTLAQEHKSVALVDLELQFGDVALMLDIKPDHSVRSAIDEDVASDPISLMGYLIPGPAGVHVLPSSPQFSVNGEIDPRQATDLLAHLAELYDYVIVDMPPIINEVNAAALDASALVLLVTSPEVTCLRRTHECLQLLRDLGFSEDRLKVVLNRTTFQAGVNEQEAEAALGHPITWHVANDPTAARGVAYGRPVALIQPRTPLAAAVRTIAGQIAGLPSEASPAGFTTWLRRLGRPGS